MILKEGGNIFKTDSGPLTQRIATKDVDTTVQFLEIITGYDWMSEKGDDSLPVNYLGIQGVRTIQMVHLRKFTAT